MFDTQLFIRVVRASRRRLGIWPEVAADRCVKSVRHYLAKSYPEPDPAKILQIIARSGVDRIPLQLLIGGVLGDRTSSGAAHFLGLAIREDPLGWGDPHPLFSSSFYALRNSDVASAKVSPWVHYQVFGYREARTPHPLLDADFMHQWIPRSSPSTVVDTYLGSPAQWTIETSPFVNTQRFVLDSETDEFSPPIMRMLVSETPGRWLSFGLMLIDSASPDERRSRVNAASFLVTKHASRVGQSQLTSWKRSGELPETSNVNGRFTAIPGYFLGRDGDILCVLSEAAASPDLTMVRLGTGYLSLTERDWLSAVRLIFVRTELNRDEAEALLTSGVGKLVIAPRSGEQEVALLALVDRLRLDDVVVLAYGCQANIEAEQLVIVDHEPSIVETWEWPTLAEARDVVFVLPLGDSVDNQTVDLIDEWLSLGSSLLNVDASSLKSWSRVFDRPFVVVHPGLVERVRPLVSATALKVLDNEAGQ